MSVIRVYKTKNFTVMSNTHLFDKNLSLKAAGLLSKILALPDDWNYSIKGLCAICKENETAVKNALNELRDNRYVIVERIEPSKETKGRIQYEYFVYEQPQGEDNKKIDIKEAYRAKQEQEQLEQQFREKQGVENLGVENLAVESQGDILNTNISNTNKQNNSKANSFFAKKVRYRNKIINPVEVKQEELIQRIENVVEEIGSKVFTDVQMENVRSCLIYFVEKYAEVFGKKHPILKRETINDVMVKITDYIYVEHKKQDFTTCFKPLVSDFEIDDSYKEIIDMYFETEFKQDIDYSIVHFLQENVLTKLMGKATGQEWFINE